MNISLIGFMASGKSTLAKKMAKETGKKLISIDEEIVRDQGMSIDSIFANFGEEYFRKLETKKLTEVLSLDNQIIDCGGGAIIYNAGLIKEKSYVIFIDTDFEEIWSRLINDNKRPLIKNKTKEEIRALYDSRIPVYRANCNEILK